MGKFCETGRIMVLHETVPSVLRRSFKQDSV